MVITRSPASWPDPQRLDGGTARWRIPRPRQHPHAVLLRVRSTREDDFVDREARRLRQLHLRLAGHRDAAGAGQTLRRPDLSASRRHARRRLQPQRVDGQPVWRQFDAQRLPARLLHREDDRPRSDRRNRSAGRQRGLGRGSPQLHRDPLAQSCGWPFAPRGRCSPSSPASAAPIAGTATTPSPTPSASSAPDRADRRPARATQPGRQVEVRWQGDLGPDIPAILNGKYSLLFDVQYRAEPSGAWTDWLTGQPAGGATFHAPACGASAYAFRAPPAPSNSSPAARGPTTATPASGATPPRSRSPRACTPRASSLRRPHYSPPSLRIIDIEQPRFLPRRGKPGLSTAELDHFALFVLRDLRVASRPSCSKNFTT